MRKGYAISIENGKAEIGLMETENRQTITLCVRTPECELTVTLTPDECADLRDVLPGSSDFRRALTCYHAAAPEADDPRPENVPQRDGT